MVDIWISEDFQKKARTNVINRVNESHTTYTGGSYTMKRQLKIGEAKEKKIENVYYDTYRMVKEDTLSPPIVVEMVEKYKAASGSDTVEGLEVTSRMAPFNVTAWTEATRGTQKGKIRGLGNYMTSTKMLPQSLRTPSAMGNQSHSFTSQPPYAGLGTDVGYHEEVTELRHQMSQI